MEGEYISHVNEKLARKAAKFGNDGMLNANGIVNGLEAMTMLTLRVCFWMI